MNKLQATDEMIGKVNEAISIVIKSLESGDDFRKTTALIRDISVKVSAISDIYETAENKFIAYLIWDQLRYVRDFEGHPDDWYKLNAEAMGELKAKLKTFLEKIKGDFTNKDADRIVEHVKDWWPELDGVHDKVTRIGAR